MSYRIEYAKSGRSTCKVCMDKIPKGEIRVGVPNYFQNYLSYKWQHATCTVFGGRIPEPAQMEGFQDIKQKDLDTLTGKITKVDVDSLSVTRIRDIITPDKVIDRIDAKVIKIGNLMPGPNDSEFITITISDGEEEEDRMAVLGSGRSLARDLINLDLNGEYRFLGLKSSINNRNEITLRHEGGTKFDLIKSGIKKKIVAPEDWGDFKDLRLTISSRKAKCVVCEEAILGATFRLTKKGEREVQGQLWKVDMHQHVECESEDAKADGKYLKNIWNHVIDNEIYKTWKIKSDKLEQAFLDFKDVVKKKDKEASKQLKSLPADEN